MNNAHPTDTAVTKFRKLINASMEPAAGLWSTRLSKQETAAWVCLMLVLIGVPLVMMSWRKIDDMTWWGMAVTFCAFAVSIAIQLLAIPFDRDAARVPGAKAFLAWSALALLVGIPVGLGALYILNAYREIGNQPFALTHEPVIVVLASIAFYSWRLLYLRQWESRLETVELKRVAAEQGQALAEAQLKMLQAQIEPHFLFNTLASVQQLVRKDAPKADFLLTQLIRYLREAMPVIRGMGSTLGREFGLAQAYLNIARVRMGDRLELQLELAEDLADQSFPSLIVQTLVENAIRHGVEPKTGPVRIELGALAVDEGAERFIEISVRDTGVGFGVAQVQGGGVGLRNIRERLAGLYGASARLELHSINPSGVCATVRIPRDDVPTHQAIDS